MDLCMRCNNAGEEMEWGGCTILHGTIWYDIDTMSVWDGNVYECMYKIDIYTLH